MEIVIYRRLHRDNIIVIYVELKYVQDEKDGSWISPKVAMFSCSTEVPVPETIYYITN